MELNTPTSRGTRAFCAAVLGAVVAACSAAPPPSNGDAPRAFTVHWSVTTDPVYQRRSGRDLQAEVDFGGAPIERDTVILYQHRLGLFPRGGPHVPQMYPDYMDRHRAKIAEDLDVLIPDRNFSGFAVIDYECWNLIWEWTPNGQSNGGPEADDRDTQTDWREFLLSKNPDVFRGLSQEEETALLKSTYEAAAREFYLVTLRECRRLRPKAKWGFYNYPVLGLWPRLWDASVPIECQHLTRAQERNDTLQWLWDEVDFIAPEIYARRVAIPFGSGPHPSYETTVAGNRRYIEAKIKEGRRIANGKPVFGYAWMKYHPTTGPYSYKDLNAHDAQLQFEAAFDAGADGVFLWDTLKTPEDKESIEAKIRAHLIPALARMNPGGQRPEGALSATPGKRAPAKKNELSASPTRQRVKQEPTIRVSPAGRR